jgi:hypothetical protein
MIVVSVNDIVKNSPTCWEETSTEQFQRLKSVNKLDLLKAFCFLLNVDYDEVAQSTSEILESSLYQCTAFVFNQPEYFREQKHKGYFKYRDVKYKIPTKLGSLSIEQNMHIRSAMYESNVVLEQLISKAVAVYMQPIISGARFDSEQADILENEVREMPICETFPIGFFFLSKLNNFGSGGLLYLLPLKVQKLILRMTLLKLPKLKSFLPSLTYLLSIGLLSTMVFYQALFYKNHLTMSSHSLCYGKNNQNLENVIEQS